MKRKLIAMLIASLFAEAALAADGSPGVTGYFSAGYRGTDLADDTVQAAQFFKFMDPKSGPILNGQLYGFTENNWFRIQADELGMQDMFLGLKGQHGIGVKYSLFRNNIPRYITFGATAPYSGIGTGTLTNNFPTPINANTVPLWTPFDYMTLRRITGGMVEVDLNSPFYARFDGSIENKTGIRPQGSTANAGAAPSGRNTATELPAPVQYRTSTGALEFGYESKAWNANISYTASRFENDIEQLSWRRPVANAQALVTTLAPDNDYYRIAGQFVYRQMPLAGSFMFKAGYGQTTNSFSVTETPQAFNGDIRKSDVSAAYYMQPAKGLDARAYWYWADKDNNSTPVVVPGVAWEGQGYTKNNPGIEVGWRVTPENKLTAGFDYYHIKYEDRPGVSDSNDYKAFVQWRTSMLADWTGRIKYQYLKRDSDIFVTTPKPPVTDPRYLEGYLIPYDVAPLTQNLLKLAVDGSPVEMLDLGLELKYKRNDYEDNVLGRLDDKRWGAFANVSYGNAESIRFTAFADWEEIRYEARHRSVGGAVNFNPFAPPSATNFNWEGNVKDRIFSIGAGVDLPIGERIMINGSVVFDDVNGAVDFTSQAAVFGGASVPLNIPNSDQYKRWGANLKGSYALSKQVEVTAGYTYERYTYSDVQLDGYFKVGPVSGGVPTWYLTGAYANPNYGAQIVYGTLKYKF